MPEMPQIDVPTENHGKAIPKTKKLRKIDLHKAIKLKAKGNSYNDIALRFNVSKAAVHQAISPIFNLIESNDNLKEFRKKEQDLLDSAKLKVLERTLDPAALKKTSSLQASTIYCQLFDKNRLLRNESTSNLSIRNNITYTRDKSDQADDLLQVVLDKLKNTESE